jgi:hypothetical protein
VLWGLPLRWVLVPVLQLPLGQLMHSMLQCMIQPHHYYSTHTLNVAALNR